MAERTTRFDVERLFGELMRALDAPYDERNPYCFPVVDGENRGFCLDYLRDSGWTIMIAVPAGRAGSKEWMITQTGLQSGRLGIKAFCGALLLARRLLEADTLRRIAVQNREQEVANGS